MWGTGRFEAKNEEENDPAKHSTVVITTDGGSVPRFLFEEDAHA
jgi:hypothetical protein